MDPGDFNPWECVNVIRVQRELLIQNRRLAMTHCVLRVCAVGVVTYNIIWSQPWYRIFEPTGVALELWGTEGVRPRLNVSECSPESLQDLQYEYDNTHIYAPTSCADLPAGERFEKSAGVLTFPTYVRDSYIQINEGQAECATVEADCTTKGGTLVMDGSRCTCTAVEEFIVQGVESNIINLNHGYAVFMTNDGRYVQTGRSTQDSDKVVHYNEYGGGEATSQLDEGVLTIIRRPDGSECSVGGKSRWFNEAGIHGTLEEWLACGGISLDDTSIDLRANAAQEPPSVRITGVKLELELGYSNFDQGQGSSRVVCNLIVRAVPVWNSFTDLAYSTIPASSDLSGDISYRYRYAFAVTVSTNVVGSFGFLDWPLFFTAVMANLVLLQIPHQIVSMMAMNGAGLASRVYRRAQCKLFNIQAEFHGYCARLVGHAQSFRTMCRLGDEDGVLQISEFHKHILEAFGHGGITAGGELSEEDIQHAAAVIATLCDVDGDGTVKIREYISTASGLEDMNFDTAMKFFDVNRKKSILERTFGAPALSPEQKDRVKLMLQTPPKPAEDVLVTVKSTSAKPDVVQLEEKERAPTKSNSLVEQAVAEARRVVLEDLKDNVHSAVATAIRELKGEIADRGNGHEGPAPASTGSVNAATSAGIFSLPQPPSILNAWPGGNGSGLPSASKQPSVRGGRALDPSAELPHQSWMRSKSPTPSQSRCTSRENSSQPGQRKAGSNKMPPPRIGSTDEFPHVVSDGFKQIAEAATAANKWRRNSQSGSTVNDESSEGKCSSRASSADSRGSQNKIPAWFGSTSAEFPDDPREKARQQGLSHRRGAPREREDGKGGIPVEGEDTRRRNKQAVQRPRCDDGEFEWTI